MWKASHAVPCGSLVQCLHLEQRRYAEALEGFKDALERFTALGELGTVAGIWYQTGRVYQRAEQPEAAEDAYKRSLAIAIRLNDVVGKAAALSALETYTMMSSTGPRKR